MIPPEGGRRDRNGIFGQAFADAEAKESRRGKYATIIVITDDSDEAGDPSSLMVRLVAPIGLMDEAMTIKKGDRIYCEGAASIGVWHTPRGAEPSVSVEVHHLSSLHSDLAEQIERRF